MTFRLGDPELDGTSVVTVKVFARSAVRWACDSRLVIPVTWEGRGTALFERRLMMDSPVPCPTSARSVDEQSWPWVKEVDADLAQPPQVSSERS